jgi:sporulation protein YlmC with PRC-barrel domain
VVLCQGDRAPMPRPQQGLAPAPLARRNAYAPAPQQAVYLQLSQILKLPVITRSAGKSLGTVMNMWVDPARREIVSLDLEDKKSGTAPRIANIPLKSLRQIGDVILVQDETAMYGGDLDSRYGFVYLTGMEVRTRSGKVLGKVGAATAASPLMAPMVVCQDRPCQHAGSRTSHIASRPLMVTSIASHAVASRPSTGAWHALVGVT